MTRLRLFLQPQRPSSPAAMERQRNSGQVERIVRAKLAFDIYSKMPFL